MKKYLEALPIILIPFIFALLFVAVEFEGMLYKVIAVLGIIGLILWHLVSAVSLNVNVIKGKFSVADIVNVNLVVRLIYIPLYAIIFAIGCMSALLGPFGIGVIIALFLFDSMILFITSLSLISCNIALARYNVFSKAVCVLFGIGNFIFCVDVILAIVYKIALSKNNRYYC